VSFYSEAEQEYFENLAAQAVKDFQPTTPTGQKAMQELLRPHTQGKVFTSGAKTNFLKAYADFNKLTPAEQTTRFGSDAAQARSFLKGQARTQLLQRVGVGAGLAVVGKETGLTKVVLHALLD
jgi:hypothetical protein